MSHTLFKSNNVVVLGDFVYDPTGPRVSLDFTVQVNGRLVHFQRNISLIRDISIHDWRLTVKHTKVWREIVGLLGSFGYYLSDKEEYMSNPELYADKIMDGWLAILKPNQQTLEQMEYVLKS